MGTPSILFYMDDSGARALDKKPEPPRIDGLDYFALGGVLVRSEDVETINDAHRKLCTNHNITYPLHFSCIRSKKKHFRWMESDHERAESFLNDMWEMMFELPIIGHACVIHRPGYIARYHERYGSNRWELCKSAYTIAVERAAKFALREGRKLIVHIEQTGRKEDRRIKTYHREMLEAGMPFDTANSLKYAPVDSDRFKKTMTANPSFYTKANLLGQLADIALFTLAKGGYDSNYRPYKGMVDSNTILNQQTVSGDVNVEGVKYYCFDGLESEKAPEGA